jgi:hypothetical protein
VCYLRALDRWFRRVFGRTDLLRDDGVHPVCAHHHSSSLFDARAVTALADDSAHPVPLPEPALNSEIIAHLRARICSCSEQDPIQVRAAWRVRFGNAIRRWKPAGERERPQIKESGRQWWTTSGPGVAVRNHRGPGCRSLGAPARALQASHRAVPASHATREPPAMWTRTLRHLLEAHPVGPSRCAKRTTARHGTVAMFRSTLDRQDYSHLARTARLRRSGPRARQ